MNKKLYLLIFISFFSFLLSYSQESINKEKEIKKLLKESGRYFLDLKNEKSLESANKALELSLLQNNDELSAKCYNLIGLNFADFSDIDKAIEFYSKGLILANKTSNDTIKSWLNNNIANAYSFYDVDINKGVEHYKKSLAYSEKLQDEYEIVFTKLNLVTALFKLENYQNGIGYLNEVKEYVDREGDVEANITLNTLYGNYYNAINEDEKSEQFYLKTVEFCKKNEVGFINSHVLNAYKTISDFFLKKKNFTKAYEFLHKQDSLKQIVYNEEKLKSVNILGNEIEKQETNRKIEKIEAERLIQEQKIKNSRFIVILFVIIFSILLLLILSLYRNNSLRKKSNQELTEANRQLKIAKDKAEEALNVKSQFISTVSHELRTPLYGVIGTTDIIEEEHIELANSPHLKALKFSANYLLALVNDILKVYKIEENKVVLENNLFHLSDKLETIKDSLETISRKNNNKIIIDVAPEIPEFLIGDNTRLSQIIINLLSNSLKFTNNGTVTIKVDLNEKIDGDYYLNFLVADTGVGIPKKFQDTVFDKFVQIERKEDDYQGTGLGLTIVKKLVELFNGTITLESEENVGTKINFVIPFKSGESKKEEIIKESEVDLSESIPYRILVVEDNKINQVVTRRLLENHKFTCEIVDDGYAAIDILEKESFDAILMDINMPKINGFETSKIIRQKGNTIPIIAVTAFDRQEIEEKAKNAQIDDIIVKPFDSAKLFEVIRQLINK